MKIKSSDAMRFCKDCRFFRSSAEMSGCIRNNLVEYEAFLKRNDPPEYDMVYGTIISKAPDINAWTVGTALENRKDDKLCGKTAKWFEAR